MRQILVTKFQRTLSIFMGLALILQSLLPISYFGTSDAFAAVQTYNFNTAGEYTTDTKVAIFDGTASFNFTWDTSSDSIATGDSVVDLLASTDVDGLVMATTGKGTLLRSTDYGATWAAIIVGASFSAKRIIQTTANDMLLVGSDTVANKIYRSVDDGATWAPSTTTFADSFVGVAHDGTSVARNWAIASETGAVYATSDSGDTWAALAGEGLDIGGDVMWYSGNVIFASGTTAEAGALVYSTDSGGTWTDLSAKLPGTPATLINRIEKFGSNIFVSGTGYVAKITIASNINEVETAGNWTNLTANINANSGDDINFSTVGGILRTTTGVIALSVLDTDASEARVISSIDGGTDWHRHADPGTYSTPGDLVRLPSDGRFLWGVKNSGGTGDAEGLLSNVNTGSDSLVATTGISAVSIESIDITYHGTSEITDIGMVLGFTTNDSGTWYYYTGGAWTSTTTDNVSASIGETAFDTNIASFDESPGISGDVYFKFYTAKQPNSEAISPYTNSLVTIESVVVNYTAGTLDLTVPNGGEVWNVGINHNITWTSTGFSTVDISYSTNSGGAWTAITTGYATSDGANSYEWMVPLEAESDTARIKIANGDVNDSSAADFFIVTDDKVVDINPPTSTVNALPTYSPSQFQISVTARDDNSGVKAVYLWYSFNKVPGPMQGDVTLVGMDNSAPFTYQFNAPEGDGTYYFVSTAIDFANNDNSFVKRINNPPCSLGCTYPNPTIEAQTIVDSGDPYITIQRPSFNEEHVPTSGEISIRFNEAMNPDSFQILLIEGLVSEPPPPFGSGPVYLPLSEPEWSVGNTNVLLNYGEFAGEAPLLQDHWYRIKVIGYDLAGNELNRGEGATDEPPLYAAWAFKTAVLQHPDLTSSSIIVRNDDGPFRAGTETIQYRVILRNTSELAAQGATAGVTFANGLTYHGNLTASAGQVILLESGGQATGWTWTGDVYPLNGQMPPGEEIYIDFDMRVATPAAWLGFTQYVLIDDGVNEPFSKLVAITVAEETNFSTSTKTVNLAEANAGDVLRYTVTVKNTGVTVGGLVVSDPIPTHTTYLTGSLSGNGWTSLGYYTDQRIIAAELHALRVGETRSFSFSVLINDNASGTITNTANLSSAPTPSDPAENPMALLQISAQTVISDTPLNNPPEIIEQSPSHGAQGVHLTAPIQVRFSQPIVTDSFEYTVKLPNQNNQTIDTSGWNVTWSPNYRLVTITPPNQWEIVQTYTVEIVSAHDVNGNGFVAGAFSNPWNFTTIYPTVRIIAPTYDPQMLAHTTRALNQTTGEFEELQFFVGLRDFYTDAPYVAESGNIAISFDISSAGGAVGLTPNFTSGVTSVTIPQGQSQTGFYYKDSVISYPDFTTITPYENPSQGWADETKYLQVLSGDDTPLQPHLTFEISNRTIRTNTLSETMVVRAYEGAEPAPLPSRIYLHTRSTGGSFYSEINGQLTELPSWITVQNVNPTTNLQYMNMNGLQYSASIYYMDSVAGNPVLTISDNAPLVPDTGYNNVSAIISVINVDEEELILEEELEEVIDETGRIITRVEIDPQETYLLPNGVQSYTAKGFDQEDKEIPELKFKWYVLAGGGSIEKDGVGGDSHTSAFVANNQPGAYFDTVLVATLYNGEIGYAVASVYIVDVTDLGGPTALPTTGISSLQFIFIALTLAAAVALAWVESYEKQHFSADNK